jgi:tRNA-splicing ligase RtcB
MDVIFERDYQKRPIKTWAGVDGTDEKTLSQARNLSNLPFTHRHVALMPDTHLGYGMPIGGVLATRGVVIPNAVGVDIGCGMMAQKFSVESLTNDEREQVVSKIRQTVPVGIGPKGCLPEPIQERHFPKELIPNSVIDVGDKFYEKARAQLGTMGGGNHFIELQTGDDGHLWAMVHSGSRAFGFNVAKHYNELAQTRNAEWFSSVDVKQELAFLPMSSVEGIDYLREMQRGVAYAHKNREVMMRQVSLAIARAVEGATVDGEPIHIPHNYAAMEHHHGENVMVHRKGACRARYGELGIIPGSQGSSSFIVRGKGAKESFMSCSHGAGRQMGRRQAKRELSFKDERDALDAMGTTHALLTEHDLDEAPGAYKDIDEVMARQADLVDIEVTLTPIATIKGSGPSQ